MSKRRLKSAEKKRRKALAMSRPGVVSNYARKKAWLHTHTVDIPAGVGEDLQPVFVTVTPFGFQVGYPKPWK